MPKRTGIEQLKPSPTNPRLPFSQEKLDAFQKSIRKFGDLSGIIRNVRSDNLVGGHKRVEDFRSDKDVKVEIHTRLPKKDRVGTVALGYVFAHGTRWNYREVDWDEKTEAAANLAANQHGAEFDLPAVTDILKGIDVNFDLTLTGFTQPEIERLIAPETVVAGHTRSQSDADFSKFEIIMKHDNKLRLVKVLDTIRSEKEVVEIEEALMLLCDAWEKQ